MGKIIVLDENTSNKIAAGEVVERPASVIKELVENSIDAGATNISIEIRNGGISYIKVTDNGSGMDEDDVEIAFERHATSKIKRAEDLDSIITMGFRGEALASIAAVSSVELQTKTSQSTYGMYVHIVGGAFKEVRPTGCPVGTTFIIKDLFFNTPARYKFLKKDSTEAGYISDTISRIALGNPNIAFKLTSGKTNLVHVPGNNDLKSAIYSIYGKEIIKELMQVEYQDERFKISGYVGKPEAARANRNYQSLYINKRYVKSRMVSYAVEQAYSSILMKNKFPFFVLNIELNPQLVDANVHPAKMDVRFADESYLSRAIYMAVSKALSSDQLFNPVALPVKDRELFKFKTSDTQKEYVQEQLYKQTNSIDKTSESTKFDPATQSAQSQQQIPAENDLAQKDLEQKGVEQKYTERKDMGQIGIEQKDVMQTGIEHKSIGQKKIVQIDIEQKGIDYKETEQNEQFHAKYTNDTMVQAKSAFVNNLSSDSTKSIKKDSSDKSEEIRIFTKALEPLARTDLGNKSDIINNVCSEEYIPDNYEEPSDLYNSKSEAEPSYENTSLELANLKYIGQAFSTYILLQNGDELVLVDQHAAHERILYEILKVKYDSQENTTQLLLEPVVIQLQAFEFDTFKSNINLFNKIGFVFEDFGNNAIIIRGIPYLLDGCSPKDIFLELADKIQESVKPVNTPIADDMIHMIACKAAIKANKRLDDKEVRQLLIELANTG